MRTTSIDARRRAELPRTCLIVSSPIEAAFAGVRTSMRSHARQDALALMHALLAEATRTRQHAKARTLMSGRKRTDTLQRAVTRMSAVDLDSAWRAALRGDAGVVDARVLPHVTQAPKRMPKGSPWRSSSWLSRRSTGR